MNDYRVVLNVAGVVYVLRPNGNSRFDLRKNNREFDLVKD